MHLTEPESDYQIDAQLIVRHAEAMERHKVSRPEFFGKR